MCAPSESRPNMAVRQTAYMTSARLAYGRYVNAAETTRVSAVSTGPVVPLARRHRKPTSHSARHTVSTVGINHVNTLWAKFHNDVLLSVQPGRIDSWGCAG